jgi:hypothetical protein
MSSNHTPQQRAIIEAYVTAEEAYRADPSPDNHARLVVATAASRAARLLADSVDACTEARAERSSAKKKPRSHAPATKSPQERTAPVSHTSETTAFETDKPLTLF